MNYQSKLKWPMGLFYPVVIFSSYIFAILEYMLRKYLHNDGYMISQYPWITYVLVGIFFILMGFIQLYKYRLWIYPVAGLLLGLLCFQATAFFNHSFSIFKITYVITFIVMVLFVIINWRAFYSQERFEINSRRLFKLAAEMIRDTRNGFTERPYSAGSINFSKEEIQGLSRFLNGKYVVKSFFFEDKVTLAFSMNKSLVLLDDPSEVSFVTISYQGNIEVRIAEKDYQEYLSKFSFDILCESMARVFIRFLESYRSGLENRIITELKTAR